MSGVEYGPDRNSRSLGIFALISGLYSKGHCRLAHILRLIAMVCPTLPRLHQIAADVGATEILDVTHNLLVQHRNMSCPSRFSVVVSV